MRKNRSIDSTYFEMLDWYFKRQQFQPISPAAQAIMTHILHICNSNYSANCKIMSKLLAANVNVDVRTLRTKMKELAQNEYLKYEIDAQECYKIEVAIQSSNAENSVEPAKMSQFCTERHATPAFSNTIKTNKTKKLKEMLMAERFGDEM